MNRYKTEQLFAEATSGRFSPGRTVQDLAGAKHRFYTPLGGPHRFWTALAVAQYNNAYPSGTTITDLAEVGSIYVYGAAFTGNYPIGTTAADLARLRTKYGQTALQVAVSRGKYPFGTSAHDLTCLRRGNFSYLRLAAEAGHLPAGTTVHDLIADRDMSGWTSLHALAWHFHLLQITGITKSILLRTKDKHGRTAWDAAWNLIEAEGCDGFYEVCFNIVACPQLAERLDLRKRFDLEILHWVLNNPNLTQPKRQELVRAKPSSLPYLL